MDWMDSPLRQRTDVTIILFSIEINQIIIFFNYNMLIDNTLKVELLSSSYEGKKNPPLPNGGPDYVFNKFIGLF